MDFFFLIKPNNFTNIFTILLIINNHKYVFGDEYKKEPYSKMLNTTLHEGQIDLLKMSKKFQLFLCSIFQNFDYTLSQLEYLVLSLLRCIFGVE